METNCVPSVWRHSGGAQAWVPSYERQALGGYVREFAGRRNNRAKDTLISNRA